MISIQRSLVNPAPSLSAASSSSATSSTSLIIPSYLPQSLSSASIYIDWTSFKAVMHAQISNTIQFFRTLLEQARLHDCEEIKEIFVLYEDLDTIPTRILDIINNHNAQLVKITPIENDVTDKHKLLEINKADADYLIQQFQKSRPQPNNVVLFVSSRPQIFHQFIISFLKHQQKLVFINGSNKVSHPFDPNNLANPDGAHRDRELIEAIKLFLQTNKKSDLLVELEQRSIKLIHAVKEQARLQNPLNNLVDDDAWNKLILGVFTLWDLFPWRRIAEVFHPPMISVPNTFVCQEYNSNDLPCIDYTPFKPGFHPEHKCAACGNDHSLTQCPINQFVLPDLLKLDNQKLDTDYFKKDHFSHWQRFLEKQFSKSKYPGRPYSGSVRSPSERKQGFARVFLDWSQIHVPIGQCKNLFEAIREFIESNPSFDTQWTLSKIYLFTRNKDLIEKFNSRHKHYDLSKIELITSSGNDLEKHSEINNKFRTALFEMPQKSFQYRDNRPNDLVCVVTQGDKSIPNLTRLVMKGHPVRVIHNHQASFIFRVNPLWEMAVDFMQLDKLKDYQKMLSERMSLKNEQVKQNVTLNYLPIKVAGKGLISNLLPSVHYFYSDTNYLYLITNDQKLFKLSLAPCNIETQEYNRPVHIAGSGNPESAALLRVENPIIYGFKELHEVISFQELNLLFLCDYGTNKLYVMSNEDHSVLIEILNSENDNNFQPRQLCIEKNHNRLWVIDKHTNSIGYYDLTLLLTQGILRTAARENLFELALDFHYLKLLNAPSKPKTLCVGADGEHLIIYDDSEKQFCQVFTSNDTFKMDIIYSKQSSVDGDGLQADIGMNCIQMVSDVDGSYVFLDSMGKIYRLFNECQNNEWTIIAVENCKSQKEKQAFPLAIDRIKQCFIVAENGTLAHYASLNHMNKNKECKPFQQNKCDTQNEHLRCNFKHHCSTCHGAHTGKSCGERYLPQIESPEASNYDSELKSEGSYTKILAELAAAKITIAKQAEEMEYLKNQLQTLNTQHDQLKVQCEQNSNAAKLIEQKTKVSQDDKINQQKKLIKVALSQEVLKKQHQEIQSNHLQLRLQVIDARLEKLRNTERMSYLEKTIEELKPLMSALMPAQLSQEQENSLISDECTQLALIGLFSHHSLEMADKKNSSIIEHHSESSVSSHSNTGGL